MWYKLYAFGQPEVQTYEDIEKQMMDIKLEIIHNEVEQLILDTHGELPILTEEAQDTVENFEADDEAAEPED